VGEPAELGLAGIAEATADAKAIVDAVRDDVSIERVLRERITKRNPGPLDREEADALYDNAILQLAQLVLASRPCPDCGGIGPCMHR
jgi:hypothetical protein